MSIQSNWTHKNLRLSRLNGNERNTFDLMERNSIWCVTLHCIWAQFKCINTFTVYIFFLFLLLIKYINVNKYQIREILLLYKDIVFGVFCVASFACAHKIQCTLYTWLWTKFLCFRFIFVLTIFHREFYGICQQWICF